MIIISSFRHDEAHHQEPDDPSRWPLINLDARWRAAGRPIGRHPKLWLELAAPLITGLSHYLATLSEISPRFSVPALLSTEHELDAGGDLLAHRVLASAYQEFLWVKTAPPSAPHSFRSTTK